MSAGLWVNYTPVSTGDRGMDDQAKKFFFCPGIRTHVFSMKFLSINQCANLLSTFSIANKNDIYIALSIKSTKTQNYWPFVL